MKGKISNHHQNGNIWILGEDGVTYYTHARELSIHLKRMRGIAVKFDPAPPLEGERNPRAINVSKVDTFVANHAEAGEWLPYTCEPIEPQFRMCRCSACGSTATQPSKFCPRCGVPMTRSDEIIEIANRLYPRARK